MLAIFRSYISFLSSGSVANVPLLAAGTHIRGFTFTADTNERKNERLAQKWNFDCINYSEFVKEIYQQRTCLSIVQFVLALKMFFVL